MATMFLPAVVTRIPLYILWKQMGLFEYVCAVDCPDNLCQ